MAALPKAPWRIQGDIALNETDPIITVFLGPVMPADDETGQREYVHQDTSNSVQMKLSELVPLLSGGKLDPAPLLEKRSQKIAAEKAERAAQADRGAKAREAADREAARERRNER